jgi:hypothetical protein
MTFSCALVLTLDLLPCCLLQCIGEKVGPSALRCSKVLNEHVKAFDAFKPFGAGGIRQAWEWDHFFEWYGLRVHLPHLKEVEGLTTGAFFRKDFETPYLAEAVAVIEKGKKRSEEAQRLKDGLLEAWEGDSPLGARLLSALLVSEGWIELRSDQRLRLRSLLAEAPQKLRFGLDARLKFQDLMVEWSSLECLERDSFLEGVGTFLMEGECEASDLRFFLGRWQGFPSLGSVEQELGWIKLLEKGLEQTGYVVDIVRSVRSLYAGLLSRDPSFGSLRDLFEEKWGFGGRHRGASKVRSEAQARLREYLGEAPVSDLIERLGGGVKLAERSLVCEEIVRLGDRMKDGSEKAWGFYAEALVEWALLDPEYFMEDRILPLRKVSPKRRAFVLMCFLASTCQKGEAYLEAFTQIEAELPSGAHRDLFRLSEDFKAKLLEGRHRLAALGSRFGCVRDRYAKQVDHHQRSKGTQS